MDDELNTIQKICDNILDCTNSYSFAKLDDQQVYSLMRLREISNRVINGQDTRVTKNDVINEMSFIINRLAGECKDIGEILNLIPYKGLDDQQLQHLLRLKELLSSIVEGAKDTEAETSMTSDYVGGADAWITDSLEEETTGSANDDLELMEVQSMGVEGEQILALEHMIENEEEEDQISHILQSVIWPPNGSITREWVLDLMRTFDHFTKVNPPSDFQNMMPADMVENLLDTVRNILHEEPNCVDLDCLGDDSKVVIVGDIHGHYHDLLHLFQLAKLPSENQFYVFNGDYVDRGAWGLEVFLVLSAWKVLMPNRVYLLRGSHETRSCTSRYGFEKEVRSKYGEEGENIYNRCLETFKELPLGSIIAKKVYTTHGGIFRNRCTTQIQNSKTRKTPKLKVSCLEELFEIERFYIDAPTEDEDPNVLLADVLWSDPSNRDGLRKNKDRGSGLLWGPACTEAFLKQSNLKLMIRSHEGPDARDGREDLDDMLSGYSIDHEGESGKLYTLFSAPDYPQFGKKRYNNKGAYAVLQAPNFDSPSFHTFRAVHRPKADAYYVSGEEEYCALDSALVQALPNGNSSQKPSPATTIYGVDFEAVGISNPPSWNVKLTDESAGPQLLRVPKAPVVEGLPLPANLEEPHRAAYEYFLELIAGLKFLVQTTESKSKTDFPQQKKKFN